MKRMLLLNSGVGLLLATGALAATQVPGSEDMYDKWRNVQSEAARSERGAQGPVRSDDLRTPSLTVGEGDMWDNLRFQQENLRDTYARSGAQGPVRSEDMRTPILSVGEGDMWENLRVQHENLRGTYAQSGARGPTRMEPMERTDEETRTYREGDLYENLEEPER